MYMPNRVCLLRAVVLLVVLIAVFAVVIPASAVYRTTSDDLGAYLTGTIFIPEDEGSFDPPSSAEQAVFYAAVQQLLRQNVAGAANAIDPLGYDLIEFHDTSSGQVFYVLEERMTARGLGTYALNPNAKRILNIQVPHPHVDWGTWAESVQIFLQTEALFFQIAGTHRCASPTISACSGTTGTCGVKGAPYRISDVAHYTENFYQAASNAVHDEIDLLVSISVHGYGCEPVEDMDTSSVVQISNGTSFDILGSLATRLASEYNEILFSPEINYPLVGAGSFNRHPSEPAVLEVAACELMSGGTNVQGRYINGETVDPCGTSIAGPVLSERFLHIEQLPPLRRATPDTNGASWQITIDAPLVVGVALKRWGVTGIARLQHRACNRGTARIHLFPIDVSSLDVRTTGHEFTCGNLEHGWLTRMAVEAPAPTSG